MYDRPTFLLTNGANLTEICQRKDDEWKVGGLSESIKSARIFLFSKVASGPSSIYQIYVSTIFVQIS